MHGTLDRNALAEETPFFFAELPDAARGELLAPAAEQPHANQAYGADRGPNWSAIIAIAVLHVAALAALVKLDVIDLPRPRPAPLVIDLIAEPAPPPLVERPKPEPVPDRKVTPQVATPVRIIQTPAPPPPPIAVSVTAPPAKPAPVAAPPAGPVTVADLDARMIEGKPPRYPMDSRRKHEEGTVLLRLLIGTDGRVAQVSIAQSSGFDRLDQAALQAARGWRWQPMIRDGVTVEVRGVMPIPFVLKG